MTTPVDAATQVSAASPFRFPAAVGIWAAGWGGGTLVAAPLVIALMGASLSDDLSIPQLSVVSVATWTVMAVVLVAASRRLGSGDVRNDYAVAFRPIDLVGIPVGVVTQLALVPALYVPLQRVWPDTFDDDEIAARAQDLVDRAGGWLTVLLAVVVVAGAPLVEEVVYRGLLQRSAATAVGPAFGLVSTSLFFSIVHFSPVEYPGLFLAGLVFGAGVLLTGRIGSAIVTHAAFNATGLIMVMQSSG